MKFNANKMGMNKAARPRIKVRILRSRWGFSPGVIIEPPASARSIMLAATDALGRQVAEIVTEEPAQEVEQESVDDGGNGDDEETETAEGVVVKRGRGRPRKNPEAIGR